MSKQSNKFNELKTEFINTIKNVIDNKEINYAQNALQKKKDINYVLQTLKNIDNPRQLYTYIIISVIIYGSLNNYIYCMYRIKINEQQQQKLKEFQNKLEQYVVNCLQ